LAKNTIIRPHKNPLSVLVSTQITKPLVRTFEGICSKSQTPQLLSKQMELESVAENSECQWMVANGPCLSAVGQQLSKDCPWQSPIFNSSIYYCKLRKSLELSTSVFSSEKRSNWRRLEQRL